MECRKFQHSWSAIRVQNRPKDSSSSNSLHFIGNTFYFQIREGLDLSNEVLGVVGNGDTRSGVPDDWVRGSFWHGFTKSLWILECCSKSLKGDVLPRVVCDGVKVKIIDGGHHCHHVVWIEGGSVMMKSWYRPCGSWYVLAIIGSVAPVFGVRSLTVVSRQMLMGISSRDGVLEATSARTQQTCLCRHSSAGR